MTEQLDADSAPQRKRIAVACGRCRKRKIRCSGDLGGGQPCQNCKNAGADPCLFLRVSSREAQLLNDPNEYSYNVGDARALASRAPVSSGLPYAQDLPNLGSNDVLASYRGSSAYPYSMSAGKQYYPAISSYGPQYGDDFSDYGLGVSSQPVLNHDPVSMVPSHWSSRGKSIAYGGMYMDASPPYGYGSTSLVHRPAHGVNVGVNVNAEPSGFSLSGAEASADRLLPAPSTRTPLPYPGSAKPPASSVSVSSSAATLADVATAAGYASAFDTPGLSYASSSTSAMANHHISSSRASSDAYSTGGESIFGEQERSLQSQGAAFDMSAYTAEPRRDSIGSGAHSGSTLSNGQTYVPSESPHAGHLAGAGYVGDAPSPHSHRQAHSHAHAHSHSHSQHVHAHALVHRGASASASGGSTSHADGHRVAVATRR
ncbi:hypothetical protein B0T25DRAFT_447871 [Lasiosphaeria hispida]|uniref:Zn(2)-C6 fungal-type domain-containing protein n=1 Tax=Lasiosphaeria hispida TaxID=260671 RepID=A0AAJ0MH90_9PEZI|nr:hypothetical protein B0T25DRAFT_447871 [Lasiosphaeria hispida]